MDREPNEVQDVRRVLWQWGRIDRRISDLMEQMRIAVDRANSVYEMSSNKGLDGQPHGTLTGDPVFQAVERIQKIRELFVAEIETCEAQIKEAQEFKAAVNEAVAGLTPVQRDVLRLRYCEGHNWVYIAFKLYMSEKTARRYDVQACAALAHKITIKRI